MYNNGILLADDSAFMRKTLRNILEKNGFMVVGEAENGYDAVKQYKELRPRLLITDAVMSVMTGLQALKKIKEDFPLANIIICSSMGQEPYVTEAVNAGAYGYIIKPFNEHKILSVVHKVFQENPTGTNVL